MTNSCTTAERERIELSHQNSAIGVVVIGRNEGERLKMCLDSLRSARARTVYVDSGSIDGSAAYGRAAGVLVVELEMSTPFTAARARNAGFRQLIDKYPTLEHVFFVDGDCEVASGWIEKAVEFLRAQKDVAITFGFRRERYPNKSVYNMLCDLEWQDLPVGEAKQCGGDIVVRVSAFQQVNGFRSDMICGEEPELCVRLRQNGWRIWRLKESMTIHDAAMYRFSQWWRRCMRAGFAYAQGTRLHGGFPERHWVSESRRAWTWGLLIPLITLTLVVAISWKATVLVAVYPAQIIRIALNGKQSRRENWWRALALVLGKFPEMLGQLKFMKDRYLRVQSRLIEYK